ncbi:hypothetical protein SGR_3540 [Streptomyces griseus subsp. griseus NBRC 13350]|uniref:Uncharacterized protein n=1 Tax=Streptomyces griseus subsp. griseus (strain JCM 4626 / CBS 651.72 / NBRC 13350 / KCC S-0626 / ISP 5235) TaxID=455632 RepID=B1VNZ0_STRGG|nr:hypothetical protein SGR_3540 [Streptomyces griseus subsp. griseus NBRC 13350]
MDRFPYDAGALKQTSRRGWWVAGARKLGARAPGLGTRDSLVTLPGVREQSCGPKLGCRDSGVGTRDPRFERLL